RLLFLPLFRRPRTSTLLPYSTLFRSRVAATADEIRLAIPESEGAGARPVRGQQRGARLRPLQGGAGDATGELHAGAGHRLGRSRDRKSTRLHSSHVKNSYAVFCLKKN